MVDDWSLKDKQFIIEDGYALEKTENVNEGGLFDASDIDILRQKLIEDIENLDNYTSSYNDWIESPKKDVIRVINKRFGVDTE